MSDDILEFTLEAEFSALQSDRTETKSPHRPATLSYLMEDGSRRSLSLQVKTRGDFRLKWQNCSFLALMLNFRDSDTDGTPFEGQHDVPLVTHCRETDWHEQYVLREFMAYRSYNLITEDSLNVRLARIEYVEPGKRFTTIRHAFLIEHFDALARRLGAKIVHGEVIDAQTVRTFSFGLMYVYQLLIGNTDFSARHEHNILLLQTADGRIIPVPYDLDFSGAVNAKYAKPDPRLDLPNVRSRLYRGFCEPTDLLERVLDQFLERKASLNHLYEQQPGLTDHSRKFGLRYLNSFFAIVESPDARRKVIQHGCW